MNEGTISPYIAFLVKILVKKEKINNHNKNIHPSSYQLSL